MVVREGEGRGEGGGSWQLTSPSSTAAVRGDGFGGAGHLKSFVPGSGLVVVGAGVLLVFILQEVHQTPQCYVALHVEQE